MMALVESQTYCGCEYYCDDYWCDYCEWCGKEGAVKTPTLRVPAPLGPKPAASAVSQDDDDAATAEVPSKQQIKRMISANKLNN